MPPTSTPRRPPPRRTTRLACRTPPRNLPRRLPKARWRWATRPSKTRCGWRRPLPASTGCSVRTATCCTSARRRASARPLSSYARVNAPLPTRVLRMIHQTVAVEIVSTATEVEALLLEANLIKRLKPRYNVLLRDDKTFPNILLPAIIRSRRSSSIAARNRSDGRYFGPFATAGAVNRTLNTLQKRVPAALVFGLRYSRAARGPACSIRSSAAPRPARARIDGRAYAALVAKRTSSSRKQPAVQDRLAQQMRRRIGEARFRARRAIARPHSRDEPHPFASRRSIRAAFRRGRCLCPASRGRRVLHPGVLLPGRPELGQPAYFPRHGEDVPPEKCSARSSRSSTTTRRRS